MQGVCSTLLFKMIQNFYFSLFITIILKRSKLSRPILQDTNIMLTTDISKHCGHPIYFQAIEDHNITFGTYRPTINSYIDAGKGVVRSL